MRPPRTMPRPDDEAAHAWPPPADPDAPWTGFQERYRHSYHMGLYLAVNAIPGAFAVIDGPDCLYRKAEWIHVTHDSRSDLVDPCGEHRIVSTLVNAEGVIQSTGEELRARLLRVGQIPRARLALVNSMPHVTLIGTQYDRILASLEAELPFPVAEVPSRSLDGDWLDGFADTLEAIASVLDLSGGDPRPGRAAVIGNLMDRNEADHRANVAEIERLVAASGQQCVSVWLSGRDPAHLACVRDAGVLLALPHGRKAARRIAARTGARVIDVPLPLGLPATSEFVRRAARAGGDAAGAEAWLTQELARVTPSLEWAVQRFLVGARVAFCGDPAWIAPLASMLEEVGARLVLAAAPARRPSWAEDTVQTPGGAVLPVHWAPTLAWLGDPFGDTHDVVLSDSLAARRFDPATVIPIGFPCFERHALFDAPFLGTRGWLWLLDMLLQRLVSLAERQRARG